MEEIKSTYIMSGQYYTKAQAAKYLKVLPCTLQRRIKLGHMPATKIPGMGYLIRYEDLIEFEIMKDKKKWENKQ